MEKMYLCIDLKSFFASVECVERGLNSLTTKLVVCDPTRGPGSICLAVSPALKALGVKNRCRVFDIPDSIEYIVAKPRMGLYLKYAADIYAIYLKYVCQEDIFVYSIDECFIDITPYMKLYGLDHHTLAKRIRDQVQKEAGICATVGIGTNLFLAKVALDITAKKSIDFIGYLDDEEFKRSIWHHRPITDVWNIGRGISARLGKYGCYDLYGVTQIKPEVLYKEFGVNAEFLIDHAHGYEPCTISEIKAYKPKSHSLSQGQVLFSDYEFNDALIVLKEMVELNVLGLVDRHLVTNSIGLYVGYSKGVRKSTGGQMKLDEYTNSNRRMLEYFEMLFRKTTDPKYPIRQISIGFGSVLDEEYRSINLFSDHELDAKERALSDAIIQIKSKYGKNAILKGMNLEKKATTINRNKMIGGHNSE